MSIHGMVKTVQDHPTYRKVDGQWKSFKYTEPFSCYYKAKHWVDDVNNCHHDPIGLEEVWETKWWAMHQFTFLCLVAEVNAAHSRAQAKSKITMPQLKFFRKLAQQKNTLDAPPTPEVAPVRVRRVRNVNHRLVKRKLKEGSWNPDTRRFKRVSTDYVRLRCHRCQKKMQDVLLL
jgi:hypothetical protein